MTAKMVAAAYLTLAEGYGMRVSGETLAFFATPDEMASYWATPLVEVNWKHLVERMKEATYALNDQLTSQNEEAAP